MWRKSGKYNPNTALQVKKMNPGPRLYFNPLIFFLANYTIVLGFAILKHLGWAVLVCTSHRAVLHAAHPPPLSFAQGRCAHKWGQWGKSSSACASWGLRWGEVWWEGKAEGVSALPFSPLLPQEQQYQCSAFPRSRAAASPARILRGIFAWFCSGFPQPASGSRVLKVLTGCTSHWVSPHTSGCSLRCSRPYKWINDDTGETTCNSGPFVLSSGCRSERKGWMTRSDWKQALKMREVIPSWAEASCGVCKVCLHRKSSAGAQSHTPGEEGLQELVPNEPSRLPLGKLGALIRAGCSLLLNTESSNGSFPVPPLLQCCCSKNGACQLPSVSALHKLRLCNGAFFDSKSYSGWAKQSKYHGVTTNWFGFSSTFWFICIHTATGAGHWSENWPGKSWLCSTDLCFLFHKWSRT